MHERESAAERLQSRWSAGSRVIADKPPSQPLSLRQMSKKPSRGDKDRQVMRNSCLGSTVGRLQHSSSKWTSGSKVITDSPPLQPLSRRESAFGKRQQSGPRWSSGSLPSFDTASSQSLVRHRMIVSSSVVSALKHSATMKNHGISETAIRNCCINLSRIHLFDAACGIGTRLNCIAPPSA